jgi:hypothetical protein
MLAPLGVPIEPATMRRLTARLLLCLALVGNLAPLALAATAKPLNACCVRKAVHHCHDSVASETAYLVIRGARGCNHDCCRAVTTAQWAQPQPRAATAFLQNVEAYLFQSTPVSAETRVSGYPSTRAPPHFFVA